MNNTSKIIAFLTGSALVTAPLAQPESDIATPVEKTEITQNAPNLGQKQKEDWQRLREERKLARQQILSDIKANAKDEIKGVQQDIVQQKMMNNVENENRENFKENFFNTGPREKENNNLENLKPETLPFDIPHPGEHGPIPRGPKI